MHRLPWSSPACWWWGCSCRFPRCPSVPGTILMRLLKDTLWHILISNIKTCYRIIIYEVKKQAILKSLKLSNEKLNPNINPHKYCLSKIFLQTLLIRSFFLMAAAGAKSIARFKFPSIWYYCVQSWSTSQSLPNYFIKYWEILLKWFISSLTQPEIFIFTAKNGSL